MYVCVCVRVCPFDLSIYLSISLCSSIYLSISVCSYLSIYLSDKNDENVP